MRAEKCGEMKLKTDFLATFGQPELLSVSQVSGHRHPRRRVAVWSLPRTEASKLAAGSDQTAEDMDGA